jgi:hypothetical protein
VRLRAAGQALGRPRAAVVQVSVVLPREPHAAEHVDGGFGYGAIGLAGPQGGNVSRHRSLGRTVRGRDRRIPGGRRDGLEFREHVDTGVRDGLEGADRLPELHPVLRVRDGRVQAPADAAGGLCGGREQEVTLSLVQRGHRVIALAEQHGRDLVEGGNADPPGQVQAQLPGSGVPQGSRFHQEHRETGLGHGRDHDDVGHVARHDVPPVPV